MPYRAANFCPLAWLAAAACLALCGCAQTWSQHEPSLPLRHQIVREQLVIHSDQRLPRQHRLLNELVAQRAKLLGLLDLPASDEPIYVYLFDSPESFRAFMQSRYPGLPDRRAFFVERDTRLEVYAAWGDHVAEDMRHEVAHGYLHSVAPAIGLWLDEGLAEYFEVPPNYDGLNPPHVQHLLERLDSGWRPNLRRLETLTSAGEMEQIDYAESWAWVHLLLKTNQTRKALLRAYLHELRTKGAAPPLSSHLYAVANQPEQLLEAHVRQLANQVLPSAARPPLGQQARDTHRMGRVGGPENEAQSAPRAVGLRGSAVGGS